MLTPHTTAIQRANIGDDGPSSIATVTASHQYQRRVDAHRGGASTTPKTAAAPPRHCVDPTPTHRLDWPKPTLTRWSIRPCVEPRLSTPVLFSAVDLLDSFANRSEITSREIVKYRTVPWFDLISSMMG